MEAVLYCRYSSHAQREVSIDQQIAACRAFADRLGISVQKVYEDHALSGTSDRRPAFQRMINEAAELDYQYVIVYSLDRFARDRYDSAVYKRQLRQHGKKVISATENITDDPSGGLLEAMLEALAEYYSRELAQKIRRGMEDNASRCMVTGSIPFGYKKGEDGRYEIDEAQAEIVREIYTRVLAGDRLIWIAEDLNRRGYRTKKGAKWNRSSFNRILSNERYAGVYIYQDKRIEGGIPQIIDRATFDAVQHAVATKPNPRGGGPKPRRQSDGLYLLTGRLFCGECESPLVGISGTSKTKALHHYYVCKGHRAGSGCGLKPLRRDKIENAVASAIKEKVLTVANIELIADMTVKAMEEGLQEKAPVEDLKAELQAVEKGIANIVKAIEGGTASQALMDRLDILENRAKELREEIAYQQKDDEETPTREEIVELLTSFRNGDIDDREYQEALIDTFLLKAYVFPDRMDLYFSPLDGEDPSVVRISASEAHHSPLYEHMGRIIAIANGVYMVTCGL